jgi:hypothetical protein
MRPLTTLAGLVALLVAAAPAPAQLQRERLHTDVVAKIKEEGMQRSRVMESISFLTDVHGPRLTGSPITRQAGEWAKGRLSEWGLENARLETWGTFGRGWTLEGFTANQVAPNFYPLIAFPKAWSPSLPAAVRAQPIYLDVNTEKDLDNYRGKLHRAIVLISPPREVKALFEAPASRQSDERLLALANSDGSSPGFRGSRGGPGGTPAVGTPAAGGGARGSGNSGGTPPVGPGATAADQRFSTQLQQKKWDLCYEEGAAVVLEPARGDGGTMFVSSATMPSRASGSDRSQGNTNPFSRGPRPWALDAPPILPQVVLAVEHYNRLVRMIQKGSKVEVEIDLASRYHPEDPTSFNVLAEIPGSDLKDEVVMLGGHFDSWHSGTGATDNAVGCGVALEAVRILQAIGAKPRRTIRIALWTGEEQGLLGSQAYVAEHFGRRIGGTGGSRGSQRGSGGGGGGGSSDGQPGGGQGRGQRGGPPARYELKPAHEKFCGYFNLDNGTGKIRGVYLQGNEAVRPIFRAWLAPFSELGALTLTQSNTGGTDHLSFDGVGLPGFQFIQDPLEYNTRTHHSSMDVFDRIQEDDVKQASIIMASFVYHAAMRDEKLPRKPLTGEVTRPAEARPAEAKPAEAKPAEPKPQEAAQAADPAPGTRGNADNVPFIGRSDPKGNPVRLARSTGHVSNYTDEKVAAYTLPDPLVTASGERVTTAEAWWKQRRPEILKIYQTEVYGRIPENAPKVTWEVTEPATSVRDGAATVKRIVGRMSDKPDGPKMNLTIYSPAKATEPTPLLLSLSFSFGGNRGGKTPPVGAKKGPGKAGGFDSIGEVLGRGWSYATLGYSDIQPDRAGQWTQGVIGLTLRDGQSQPAPDEWGTISAWAWGISRAIDYFETDKSVNAKQIAITGASRLGKTALWAGAQDERVAAVFAVVPGEMGASLIRRDWGETLDDMAQNFGYQFAGNLQKYVGRWNELPVDQHMLIALCAPRPVYVNGGLSDQWSDPKGEFLALAAAGPVYKLLGQADLGTSELPQLDQPVTSGALAFHYHSSGHTAVPADWKAFLDFVERHFKRGPAPERRVE